MEEQGHLLPEELSEHLVCLLIIFQRKTSLKKKHGLLYQAVMDNVFPFVLNQMVVFIKGITFRLPNRGWEERNRIPFRFG